MKFPAHKCGLYLTHNRHRDYYQTIDETVDGEEWISEDEHHKAKASDECWVLQWYPDTPVGSYSFAASSLDALLDYVNKEFPDETQA